MATVGVGRSPHEFAELELSLHRRGTDSFTAEFRFNQPDSDADVRLGQAEPAWIDLNLDQLGELADDPAAYAQKLTQLFFKEPAVQSAFAQARTSAQTLGVPLRFRLVIGPSAPELHAVHWELLGDPQNGSPLATDENLLFSRYLSSPDWRPVRLRAQRTLRALVMVSNPSDLGEYNLAPVDVAGELQRVRQALQDIPVRALPEPDSDEHATLNALLSLLRQEEYDILYVVCHGTLANGEPWLWLESEAGRLARCAGSELVTRLQEMQQMPRLVVLATCQSAGTGAGDTMAALGPRLAEAGVPAVLAMQGRISMQTVTEFMPAFFHELQRDGQIDRALAVARGTVRKRLDYWMPALFMRLKSGRIWYVPGFSEGQSEFEKWESLAGFIQEKACTPILGPGLTESVIGSRRELAIRWAEQHGFPLEPHDRGSLPQVSQYILTLQSPAYLPVAYRGVLRESLVNRYQACLPAELAVANPWSISQVQQALDLVTDKCLLNNPANPFEMLAQLRLPIYITTWTLDFLTRALVAAGAEPVVRICPWNKWIPREKAIYEEQPTVERPLVYHLFGHVSEPGSLVFSEDKYFDFLIGITQNRELIPSAVRAALINTSLLFLGFQMEDWEFRVFFRFLMTQEGREMLKFFSHAAAQIEPEEDRIIDLKRARKYLEEYFVSENISIYWGTTEEFLKELSARL